MRRRALLALPLAAPRPTRAQPAFLPEAEALPLLRAGGLHLFIRHALTDAGEAEGGPAGYGAGARQLSAAGEEQAVRLGGAMDMLGIPVAEVLAGGQTPARETAALAFGPGRWRIAPGLALDDEGPGDAAAGARALSGRLAEPVPGGHRVLIGAAGPLERLLGRPLAPEQFPEGALALFRPEGTGWALLGFLRAEALIAAARLP